jgi:hypothetical protein
VEARFIAPSEMEIVVGVVCASTTADVDRRISALENDRIIRDLLANKNRNEK